MKVHANYTVQVSRGRWAVFAWDTYPRFSPLEGKPMMVWLDAFDTRAEALAAYPEATLADDWGDMGDGSLGGAAPADVDLLARTAPDASDAAAGAKPDRP